MLSLQCKRACNLAKQGGMWKRTPHGMCMCRVQSRAGGHPHQLFVSKISRGTRGTTSAMNGPDCHQKEAREGGHSLHHKVGEVSHPQQPMPTHYPHLQGLAHTHPTLTGSSTSPLLHQRGSLCMLLLLGGATDMLQWLQARQLPPPLVGVGVVVLVVDTSTPQL